MTTRKHVGSSGKVPTTLARLGELVGACADGSLHKAELNDAQMNEIESWLQWTLGFLTNRTLYHKKHAIKQRLLVKAANELLDPDEVERIEAAAEEELT